MADILNKIINNITQDEYKETDEPKKFDVGLTDTTPLNNKFLNNLDDIGENVGNFDIKVFGIGGAGCNVIKYMKEARTWADNVKIYALNTDVSALRKISNLSNVYLLGKKLLRGTGSGGDPLIGKSAVQEDTDQIKEVLKDTDLLFLVAGLGKGTGSGATPEIAKIAKEMGILTVAIVNLPSIIAEGNSIYQNALNNLKELKSVVNSITTISNDSIIKNSEQNISFMKAFEKANAQVTSVIGETVDMINIPGEMNIDFADIRSFFKDARMFNANTITLEQTYSRNMLEKKIAKCIDASYSDVKLTNANKIVVNLTINEDTPTTIVADIRSIFKKLANNNDLVVVAGVNYSTQSHIKVSFLVSTAEETSSIDSSSNDDGIKFYDVDANESNQQSINFDEMSKTIKLAINPEEIKKPDVKTNLHTKSFINKECFDFDDDSNDESNNQRLNSKECVDVITKAMTSVIKTTTLMDVKNKNN